MEKKQIFIVRCGFMSSSLSLSLALALSLHPSVVLTLTRRSRMVHMVGCIVMSTHSASIGTLINAVLYAPGVPPRPRPT